MVRPGSAASVSAALAPELMGVPTIIQRQRRALAIHDADALTRLDNANALKPQGAIRI